tara:strand:+ start:475 stop:1062 length:588 start_codon:yes stop_codon:yes gene_type:complete
MSAIYLASQSPRRAELLRQVGVPFTQFSVDIFEQHQRGESADAYVARLAQEKAQAGWRHCQAKGWVSLPVLGSDTVVVCDEHILEKPADLHEAQQTLQLLSGRSHRVLSALAVVFGARCEWAIATTEVTFRRISSVEIERYWATGEPCDKAGAYGIQGLGAVFVESISGSYSNVVGLPLETTVPLLKKFDVACWQ